MDNLGNSQTATQTSDALGFGNNLDSNALQRLQAYRQSINPQKNASQKAAPHYASGIGGFLEKALPVIGGAAGAIGGVALDPFTAGMASVVLGGLGSAAGQGLENSLSGQKVLQGNVAEQGVLGAVPGGLGKVADIGRAAKGGAGLVDSLAATKALPETIGRTTEADTTGLLGQAKGNLNNKFQQLEAGAGGSNAGAKLPGAGASGISLQQSQDLAALGDKYGIPAASPETKLKYIQQQLNKNGQEIDQHITAGNVPLAPEDKQAIMNEFQNRVAQEPNASELLPKAGALQDHFLGNTPTTSATIGGQSISPADLAKFGVKSGDMSGVNDLSSMNAYKQKLDGMINYSRSAASPDPAGEQAASLMRQTLNDQIGKYAPNAAAANKRYSELKQLESPALIENNRLAQSQGGLYSRLVNNNIVKGAEAKVGNIGQKLTGGTPNLAQEASGGASTGSPSSLIQALSGGNIAKKLGSQTAVRALAGAGNNNQNQSTAGATNFSPSTLTSGLSPLTGGSSQTDQSSNPSISPTQLVELIAADPTHESLYTSLYNTLNKANTTTLDATQQKDLSTGQSALGVLSNYADTLNQIQQQSGGNVASGTLATLLGKYDPLASQSDKAASAFQSTRVDTASQIASVLAGGGKPSITLIKQVEESLPNVNDSPQLAQDKMNKLIQSVQTTMQAQATPTSQIAAGLGQ
jgi:hypothetical protein